MNFFQPYVECAPLSLDFLVSYENVLKVKTVEEEVNCHLHFLSMPQGHV